MSEPTTPRPAPEAVEAAMRMFANTPWRPGEWSAVYPLLERHREHKNNEPYYIAGRILAAEVEWLRQIAALAEEVATWHIGDRDECGETARKLLALIHHTPTTEP